MKRPMFLFTLLLLLSCSLITTASASENELVILHEHTFGGTEVEYNYALINASDGGYIMAGHTSSFGAGLADAWVVKVDQEGDHQWNQTFGGAEMDVVFAIIPTPDGGYALTGVTESFGFGAMDAWLIKINTTGQVQWNQTYGGVGNDYGGNLVLTSDGGYVICGYSETFGLGASDFYLIKTDSSGTMLWNKTYGGYDTERGSSLVLTADGGFLLVGLTETSSLNSQDIWIVKTDSAGNQLWNRTIGGVSEDIPQAVISSSDGGYLITARTKSYGEGYYDAWLVKIDQEGFLEWQRTFGGTGLDYTSAVIPSHDGGYVLTGRTGSSGAGAEDMWLIKVNATGEFEFEQTFGGVAADVAYGVVENGKEGYSVAGRTSSYGAGKEDIWFIITEFEDETPDETSSIFTAGMISIWMLLLAIRRRIWKGKSLKQGIRS